MVRIRGIKCGIATDRHLLRGDGVFITNTKHIEFARKRMIDFRPENPVCAECAKNLAQIYEIKLKRALENKRQRDTLVVSSSSSLDEFDRMVYRTPKAIQLREFVKQGAPYQLRGSSGELPDSQGTEKENQDASGSTTSVNPEFPSPPSITPSIAVSRDSSFSSLISAVFNEPAATYRELSGGDDISHTPSSDLAHSTSGPAAKAATGLEPPKRKRVNFEQQESQVSSSSASTQSTASSNSPRPLKVAAARPEHHPVNVNISSASRHDDNDDDFTPSPNALNGTRLPHVQPIPKRRQFQHVVPTVHDIYMQGIIGG